MKEGYKLKMAVISGASHALDYKDNNPRATEQEIIRYITSMANQIISKIEDKDE